MSNRNRNTSQTTRPAALERLEDRQYRSGNHDIGINVNETSAKAFAVSLPVLKALGVTSVRLWCGVDDFGSDRRISSGMQRAIDYSNAGFDVTLTVAGEDTNVTNPGEVRSWFKWAAGNAALKKAVDRWEIGNEVDSGNYWNGSLKQYVNNFLKPASDALHDAGEKVVCAGVSWNPEDVKTMVGYGMLDMVDAVGFHPYANGVKLQKQRIDEVNDVIAGRKPLIATEWNVRGYENDKAKWASSVKEAYGDVHAGFDIDYYYCLFTVDTKAGPGGLMSKDGALNKPFYNAFLQASQGVASTPPEVGGPTGPSGGNTPSSTETKIALYDADTNRVISGYSNLKNGQVIDLADLPDHKLALIVVPSKSASSVKMTLNGDTRVQSDAPYAFYGDHDGDLNGHTFAAGGYSFKVTPYTKDDAAGTAFASRTIGFTVKDSDAPAAGGSDHTPEVESFSLLDARTGKVVAGYDHLTANTTIRLDRLPTTALALVANGDEDTESFKLSSFHGTHVENAKPFAFFGDSKGKLASWTVSAGGYQFSATAYSANDGKGMKGSTMGLTLKFI